MKNIFLLAIIIGLFTSSTPSEERTKMDILTSYKWSMSQEDLDKLRYPIDPDEPDEPWITEAYLTFSVTVFTVYEKWSNETDAMIQTYPYYLGFEDIDFNPKSDNPYFYNSKVGKNKAGDYILRKVKADITDVFKIIELTEEKLVMKPVGTFGGSTTVLYAQPKD